MVCYIRPTFPLLGHNLETEDPVLGKIHITLDSLLAVGSSSGKEYTSGGKVRI